MIGQPVILDLFCGAGGAAMGYYRAGFRVIGVDIEPQPDYPFTFIQDDALRYLAAHWQEYDAAHGSPPCQASTALTKGTNKGKRLHVNLIPATRELFAQLPIPTVIENVQGSMLRRDLVLCGEMFGLGVIRHRYFETSWPAVQPDHVPHRGRVAGWRHGQYFDGPYVAVYGDGGGKGSIKQWQEAMGIDWTASRYSLREAIPPAYTELVGGQMIKQLEPVIA